MLCLCGCNKTAKSTKNQPTIDISIDEFASRAVVGEYQADEDSGTDGWWHLSIRYDEEGNLYLSIYDNAAGNPGIEGPVVSLDDKQITIEYDEDYYDQLPSDKWKTEGKYLVMNYLLGSDGIILSNGGADAVFTEEPDRYTVSGHWHAPDSNELEDVIIANGTITLKGWQRSNKTEEWINEENTYDLAEDCIFNDLYFERQVMISQDQFQALLKRNDAEYIVLELDVIGNEVSEVRLVDPDESCLVD